MYSSILVFDFEKSQEFYDAIFSVLDFKRLNSQVDGDKKFADYGIDELSKILEIIEDKSNPGSSATVTLPAKDRDTVNRFYHEAILKGAQVIQEPTEVDDNYSTSIKDLNGLTLNVNSN